MDIRVVHAVDIVVCLRSKSSVFVQPSKCKLFAWLNGAFKSGNKVLLNLLRHDDIGIRNAAVIAKRQLSHFAFAITVIRYIHETSIPNLSVLPSNSRMALLAKHHMHTPNFEFMLRDSLKFVDDRFDYILIDTPPAIGYCTLNALMASKHVIIPTPCEYLSMHGIHKIEEIIQIVKKRTRSDIDYRILISMYDARSVASKVIFKKIQDMFKDKVFKTVIELDEKMKESQILHQPVHAYDQESSSAKQYMELAEEFIDMTS